jgi:hypothetical protein
MDGQQGVRLDSSDLYLLDSLTRDRAEVGHNSKERYSLCFSSKLEKDEHYQVILTVSSESEHSRKGTSWTLLRELVLLIIRISTM